MITLNELRRSFYLDSVALMRLSRRIAGLDGVAEAALMMGSPSNQGILADAGLLTQTGQGAGGGDLIIAIQAETDTAAQAALAAALADLDAPTQAPGSAAAWQPKSLRTAQTALPGANLALISVPGDFACAEARKAIRRGLHAMIFSDNVSLEAEAALKAEARDLGRLVMGPDCGTAILGGTPLAFANVVPRGPIGVIGASGTGIQEVTCLIAQSGGGVSHAIGVGGRDLKSQVGGISTLMAIDALAADPGTERIVLIAKPPAPEVAMNVLARLGACGKPAVVCFMGAPAMALPAGVTQVFALRDAAFAALELRPETAPPPVPARGGTVLGLFSGGTLAAEAQVVFRDAGQRVGSNAPVAGAGPSTGAGHLMLDLGDDTYTQGRPHPMIDPAVRDVPLAQALMRGDLAAVLLDVVIGYGAHADPAAHLAAQIADRPKDGPVLIASVTGTDADPQNRSAQVSLLEAAGVAVAPSNADAAAWALAAAGTEG